MKKFVSLILSLAFAGSTFAQMSGYSSSQSDGTTLGANETLTADGIALGNAVKLRGYINTTLYRKNDYSSTPVTEDYDGTWVGADMDFLVDLSPITAEVHLAAGDEHAHSIGLEQAFGRYSFNQDFHLTFGRQVTVLGYDSDEKNYGYAVTNAWGEQRKSYVDGLRLNYNNGMFGFVLGLHDSYGLGQDGQDPNDGIAVDLAASIMFFPGLEARLGLANENGTANDDVLQFNGWLEWNPNDLTLAIEFDTFDFAGDDAWDLMLLAHYQFNDLFGASLRYSHQDYDAAGTASDSEEDRISLALLFSLTNNFDLNFEYTHVELEEGSNDDSAEEFYLQALLSY